MFDVEGARKAGYSDAEIADHLGAEIKFDVSGARKAGYGDGDIISHLLNPTPAPQAQAETYGPPAPTYRRGTLNTKPQADFQAQETIEQKPLFKGMRDPIQGGAQLLTRGLEAAAPAGSGFEAFMKGQRQNVENLNRADENAFKAANPNDDGQGRAAGTMLATLPLAAITGGASLPGQIAAGAGTGAAASALQPVDPLKGDYWQQKRGQIATGAVGGGAAGAAGGVLSRVLSPQVSPNVRTLVENDVQLTPGQIYGGWVKNFEDKASSIPLIGDFIGAAQRRSVNDLNRAVVNRTLAPIGEEVGRGAQMGRETIDDVGQRVSQAYNDLLPRLTLTVDRQLQNDVTQLHGMAQNLPPAQRDQFNSILQREFIDRVNPQTGNMTGETMKAMESELGRLAAQYRFSAVGSERELGGAIQELQSTMRQALTRSNPAEAQRLQAINEAYSNLIRLENAGGRAGAREGVFSPSQLNMAVRQTDKSRNKRAFARGNAQMQDLSDAGMDVLGRNYPDSGTAGRAMVGGLMLAGPSAALGAVNLPAAAVAGLGILPYTPGVQRLATSLLAGGRTGVARPAGLLGEGIRAGLPLAGVGAGLLAQ